MRFDYRRFLILSILLSLAFIFHSSHADTLDTQLSRDKIVLGETLTVSFTMNTSSHPISPDFSILEKDFRILNTSYGSAITMLNGVTTTQTFWQLTLEPKRVGHLIIPEINFGNAKSIPQELIVEKSSDPIRNIKQDSSVFVRAEVSTTTPYIQSQVLYKFMLFYQSQLDNSRIEIPQTKDGTFAQLGDGRSYQTVIKGKPYFVVEKNFAFFPQTTGTISIPSAHFTAQTYDVNSSTMYDSFYIATPKPLALNTQAFTLSVQNIPDKYQGSTWLPAKNISLNEKWSLDPGQWELGIPITRTITLEADGLRADQIPDLSIDKIPGVNIYVDPPKRSNSVRSDTVMGTLEQKITYIPTTSPSFTIPTLKLHWWNTETNANAITQLKPITVSIKGKISNKGAMTSNVIPAAMNSVSAIPNNQADKDAMTANKSEKKNKEYAFYLTIWFWVAIFLFLVWVITLWLFWKKRLAKETNPKSDITSYDTPELNEKMFEQACHQGNAILAQRFLLSWSKKYGKEIPMNLEKLCETISDDHFKNELQNLVQAIYAKQGAPWNGHALFAAFQKAKKQRKNRVSFFGKTKNRHDEPLPPLNPR